MAWGESRWSSNLILSPTPDAGDQGHRPRSVEGTGVDRPIRITVLDGETGETTRLAESFRQRSPGLLEQFEERLEVVGAAVGNGLRCQDRLENLLDRLLAVDCLEESFVLLGFSQQKVGVFPGQAIRRDRAPDPRAWPSRASSLAPRSTSRTRLRPRRRRLPQRRQGRLTA
jgi:hypothetical protein